MRYILLLFVFLISYGSLYPFRFSGDLLPISELINWLFNLSYRTTKADIVANILLFIPFGFVSVMMTSASRKLFTNACWLLLGGTILAFFLQYLQFYLPARVPSSVDALYNSLGIIIGMLLSHVIKQYSQNHLSHDYSKRADWSQITIPLLLALIWVAWRLFPFVPIFTTKSMLAAVSPLMQQPELNFSLIIRDLIGWLIFFYLLTRPPFDKLPRFRVLKIIFYILGLEIIIRNNTITVNDMLSALIAFALFTSLSAEQLNKGLTRGLGVAIILTLISPFVIAEPSNEYLWLPFKALMKGNPWINGEFLLLKIYLYGSFIYMLKQTWFDWLGSTLITIGLVVIISIIQIYIGTQNPEFTDPLLVALIAWALSQVEKTAEDERARAIN
ncbi:MAG: glycopeptide antibiotics resistance protein [Enterobacterales bacterium]|jgi:glycopeptide antibiotics resistance protein